ncbi:ribosome small subunit-dependent GTPase A [Corynebacterium otitidis]
MARRRFDESDVKIRPGKGSRPRTKKRPRHDDALFGMVVSKDRGRWGVVLDEEAAKAEPAVVACMRARELGRTPIEVGDRVGVVGDTSGRPGTLARIVILSERSTVLRRTADDTDSYERTVVANAELLLIVTAVADPPPREGFIERGVIAAVAGGLKPVVCLTKTDLADPGEFASRLADLDVPVLAVGTGDGLDDLKKLIAGRVSALIGHSGVGKSTLVNRLVPDAHRETGDVSAVGKGRHTSTQAVALRLPEGGWVIDTPGIRSLGLAHVSEDDVIGAFEEIDEATERCPRGCGHLGPPADPECELDRLTGADARRADAVRGLLTALRSKEHWED